MRFTLSDTPRTYAPAFRILAVLFAAVAILFYLSHHDADAQTTNCPTGTHSPDFDPEVLVGTTATKLPMLCGRRGAEVFNNGPATIWCSVSSNPAHARVNRSRPILAGTGYGMDVKDTNPIYCIAESAQVQGAGTILMELR